MTLPRGYDEWRLAGPDEYRTAGEEREAEMRSELEAAHQRNVDLEEALRDCLDYFEARSDVKDGDYGIPKANKEMRMLQMIEDALK